MNAPVPGLLRESADITRAHQSLDGVSWNILGQVYTPKQLSEDSFCWHATFPEETFVPPHLHVDQDEYIFVLEGRIDLILAGQNQSVNPGDLVRMPRGIAHAFSITRGGSRARSSGPPPPGDFPISTNVSTMWPARPRW